MLEIKRILVPTDFSEFGEQALLYGCELAKKFNSELHLLNVVQDAVAMFPEPNMMGTSMNDLVADMQALARKQLERMPDLPGTEDLKVVREVRVGPAFLEIVRYAKKSDIDLIVIGTHGRTGIKHMLLGSVAEKVVRKAPCPVLTVSHPEREFVMPT
ncbi:MAG: universal stress protein [Planctomycetota bacterium]|jgi:nucleotide-binding universal stress UspA family protein|uniref:universal stress protein n=1 Tax=uncultured Gimesia sp. TaxID=1678688 RepID=UPI002611A816|nr:universal stress protein [uncultured Gimesia sp.]